MRNKACLRAKKIITQITGLKSPKQSTQQKVMVSVPPIRSLQKPGWMCWKTAVMRLTQLLLYPTCLVLSSRSVQGSAAGERCSFIRKTTKNQPLTNTVKLRHNQVRSRKHLPSPALEKEWKRGTRRKGPGAWTG